MTEQPSPEQADLLSTDDAMVWAEEFCRIFAVAKMGERAMLTSEAEGLMVGWFANAIETAKQIDRDRR